MSSDPAGEAPQREEFGGVMVLAHHRLLIVVFTLVALVGLGPTASPAWARSKAPSAAEGGKKSGKRASKKASKRKRRGKVKHYHYAHKVQRGEVLGAIAKRYQVKVRHILKWNDLPSAHLVRAGQMLHVWTRYPIRPQRELQHEVKRGESLITIAKKYDTDPKTLQRINRIRDPRRLRAGQKIKVIVEGPEEPSVSKGRPNAGKLVNGEQLPPGPGYNIRSRRKAWGTNSTVTHLLAAFKKMAKRFPRSRAAIGDLSRKRGGEFPPHLSHQNGRDVDISLYKKGVRKLERFVTVTPKTIDAERNLALIDSLLDTGGVQYIFIDYPLQKVLYEEAKRRRWGAKKLRKVFQYPRGRHAGAVIMDEKGHDDHMHVRFQG